MTTRPLNVTIVGAGIGGLAAAVALRKSGHCVKVYESSKIKTEIGAGLGMQPNAVRVLNSLGVKRENLKGCNIPSIITYSAATAERRENPVPKLAALQQEGAQGLACHRSDLYNELRRLATGDDAVNGAPVQLYLGSRVRSCDPETATITLESGETVHADLLIGADGVHSTIRTSILGREVHAQPSGWVCYRCLFDPSSIAEYPELDWFQNNFVSIRSEVAQLSELVAYPIRGTQVINFGGFDTDQEPTVDQPLSQIVSKESVLKSYTDFHPKFLRLLDLPMLAPIIRWQLRALPLLPTWIKGRTVIIGDAAHATLPLLGQGAAMAIEEAGCLGVLFSGEVAQDQVAARLEAFYTLRKDRGEFVNVNSVAQTTPANRIEFLKRVDLQEYLTTYDTIKTTKEYLETAFGRGGASDLEKTLVLLNTIRPIQVYDPEKALQQLVTLADTIEEASSNDIGQNAHKTIEIIVFLLPLNKTGAESSIYDQQQTHGAGAGLTCLLSTLRRCPYINFTRVLTSHWPSISASCLTYSRAVFRTHTVAELTPESIGSAPHAFTTLISLVSFYSKNDRLRSLIMKSTPILELIVSLWRHEAHDYTLGGQLAKGLGDLFPVDCLPSTSHIFQLHILALDVRTIESLVTTQCTQFDASADVAIIHLKRAISTLVTTNHSVSALQSLCLNLETVMLLHDLRPLRPSLVKRNFVGLVTEALLQLTAPSSWNPKTCQIVLDALHCIFRFFNKYLASLGIASVIAALELGLLVGLAHCNAWLNTTGDFDSNVLQEFRALLTSRLPIYMVHLPVLRHIHQSLKSLGSDALLQLQSSDAFPRGCNAWLHFVGIACARMPLANSSDLERKQQCQSASCHLPVKFRCGGCVVAAYCSSTCQQKEWSMHQKRCRGDPQADPVGIDDSEFTLCVVKHYLRHPAVLIQISEAWMHQKPPFYAGVDYTVLPSTMTFVPPKTLPGNASDKDMILYATIPIGGLDDNKVLVYWSNLNSVLPVADSKAKQLEAAIRIIQEDMIPDFKSVALENGHL
ncbi:FAD/NAD(P)-binding domain-containing protein [Mycena indigotica]|uniref:FAD/NAD(P)-binding domain-containing protein n=1 Tax=Mycena indigotica TaxID=2126181 RepID=A0A8H6WHR3_9AGAR|nr:FAD/NAD(P)-binding domain-containing protein [Mycena indigotica]KAF7312714.1 FAD/NAD(P)-binding domain-containing protein [Mycena indigotica]